VKISAQAGGKEVITDSPSATRTFSLTLRVKESDRIAALEQLARRLRSHPG